MLKTRIDELEEIISKYKTVSRSDLEIVNGNFIKIGRASYTLADGKTIVREEIIKNKGMSSASIIFPITENNEIILIIQPRVVTALGVGIELPSGYIDTNETGYDAALRELQEETGYIPNKLIKIGEYYQDQGCSKALNECFLATGCKKHLSQKLDENEIISLFMCSHDELLDLISLGYINDAGSIITAEKAGRVLM